MRLNELTHEHKQRIQDYLIRKVVANTEHMGHGDFMRAGDNLKFEWREDTLVMYWPDANGKRDWQDQVSYVVSNMTHEQSEAWIASVLRQRFRANELLRYKWR